MAFDFGRLLVRHRHYFLKKYNVSHRRKSILMSSEHNVVVIVTRLTCFLVLWYIFSVLLSCVYCSCDSVYCRCEVPLCKTWYVNSHE